MTSATRVEHGRATADWLALREPADAAARSSALIDDLLPRLRHLSGDGRHDPLVVHDLGSGTGAQRRWLAPRLPSPQRWVEHDRDAALAAGGRRDLPSRPEPRCEVAPCACELAALTASHLAGADLVTASALLDVLTAPALERLIAATARLRVPLLVSLSVVGRVRLSPTERLDAEVLAAFNEHQRRPTIPGGRLLGPEAVAAAATRLVASGAVVRTAPSPWRLTRSTGALLTAWLDGWLCAAVEQRRALAPAAAGYRRRRLADIAAERLDITVDHLDLLAWWP